MKLAPTCLVALLASTNKIRLWGEHAVKDVEKAILTAFHAVENSEPVKEIEEFAHAMQALVASVANSHGDIPVDLQHVSAELAQRVDDIIEQLVAEFSSSFSEPRPEDKTVAYKTVEQAVVLALDRVEEAIVAIYASLGIPELDTHEMFAQVRPHIKHVVLVLYKLAEEQPGIVVAVVAAAVTMLLPEDFFLLPIMHIFGWGTKGPVKGSAAAWMQRVFFPASIPKGSWFAQMQRVSMAKL